MGFEAIRTIPATESTTMIHSALDELLLGDNKNIVWSQDFMTNTVSITDVRTTEVLCRVKILPGDTWGDIEEKVKQQV